MDYNITEIEVGEIEEDGLRLWCAKLALEYAKKRATELDTAVQRLKNRANSLLGWTVSLVMAISILLFTHKEYFLPLILMLILLITVSMLCVITLYPLAWIYTHFTKEELDNIQNHYSSELRITESMTIDIQDDNNANLKKYQNIQKKMQWAWILFIASPIVGFLTTILINSTAFF